MQQSIAYIRISSILNFEGGGYSARTDVASAGSFLIAVITSTTQQGTFSSDVISFFTRRNNERALAFPIPSIPKFSSNRYTNPK